MSSSPPCVRFEDEHLLLVEKPSGWNTHSPSPFAGEGIYEWLRHREPRWATLAIIHRLDKETSGLLLFTKTEIANRSLTHQFAERRIRKGYVFLTDRPVAEPEFQVRSNLARLGDRYRSQPHGSGLEAETHFRRLQSDRTGATAVAATPLTGRTHQIRVHASDRGLPVLGDGRYGGSPFPRLCLHAAELTFQHPVTDRVMTFESTPDFHSDPVLALRQAFVQEDETNAFRVAHGHPDHRPGHYIDRLGDFLLSTGADQPWPTESETETLAVWRQRYQLRGVYHKSLRRQPGCGSTETLSPANLLGEKKEEFVVRENGIQFNLSFREGYSVGLFLDQRDNRRRLLTGHVAGGFPLFLERESPQQILNAFAYTCAFSVCAAVAGHATTSLDLSRKYLDWGRRNFQTNGLDPSVHDFIYGDAFDWMRRLGKKNRSFDLVLLDPPTFSRSKDQGTFQAERDYGRLVGNALGLIKPRGVLFASSNAAGLKPEDFLDLIHTAVRSQGRVVQQEHYFPQPPDFPIDRDEPAYLKTVWMRIA